MGESNLTEIQLNADDLVEYESAKSCKKSASEVVSPEAAVSAEGGSAGQAGEEFSTVQRDLCDRTSRICEVVPLESACFHSTAKEAVAAAASAASKTVSSTAGGSKKSHPNDSTEMIGVNPTKIQLNADDLAEYESAKSRWRRAPAKSFPRKLQSQQKEAAPEHRDEVNTRIGVTGSERPSS
eukprot:CAMPEP_0173235614 /NCGR_PEP_ID=MMETSP1142-20121109/10952_1 /TAXON_ID=483371 /ORGANISM="non described non described, Strain CCMP2298" /LENGTH=181 /DNA_ID=CAMNT_0014165931 /DNA_START=181 /DNA_END=728 /DNA_ORIENTATION=+